MPAKVIRMEQIGMVWCSECRGKVGGCEHCGFKGGFPKLARVVKCECGEEVVCDQFTNTCHCGADYNTSGSKLADRSQWGAETGESVSDILAVDSEDGGL